MIQGGPWSCSVKHGFISWMYCDLERDWTLKLEPFPLWNYSQESPPEELKEWLMFQFSSLQGLVQPDLVFWCLEHWSELRSPRGLLGSWMIWWDRGECWADAECTCAVLMIVSPCGSWCLTPPAECIPSSLTHLYKAWPAWLSSGRSLICICQKKNQRNCILFWGVTACGKKIQSAFRALHCSETVSLGVMNGLL